MKENERERKTERDRRRCGRERKETSVRLLDRDT